MKCTNDYSYQRRKRCGKTANGNMTPEEFAWRMKERGIVREIRPAREYVEQTGKKEFLEAELEKDMEDAWRYFDTGRFPERPLLKRMYYDEYEDRWWWK